jgi:hypothetical protein
MSTFEIPVLMMHIKGFQWHPERDKRNYLLSKGMPMAYLT